jgi:hypothetical protein
MECEHQTNYYIEKDAPIVLYRDGDLKHITYRCVKCKKQIYTDRPWEKWKEVADGKETNKEKG